MVVRAELNGGRNRTAKTPWFDEFETYDRSRFAYLTGDVFDGRSSIEDRQRRHEEVCKIVFRSKPRPEKPERPEPKPAGVTSDDHELLARAFKAKYGDKLRVLYEGDTSGHKSDSEADYALASGIAYWTGPDPVRIARLMWASKLAREKWDRSRRPAPDDRAGDQRAQELPRDREAGTVRPDAQGHPQGGQDRSGGRRGS